MIPPDPATVREDLLAGRPEAVATVRAWVAGTIRSWRLEDPEAAVQEVTMKIVHLAAAGRILPEHDFRKFVLTVSRHACIDRYRRERLRGSGEPLPAHSLPSPDPDPHESLERKERQELLRFIFQALPPDCRELWRWIYGEGLSAGEVGERLGLTANNVRVRAHRCLSRAREIRLRFFPEGATGDGVDDDA